jgi:hypothetical protein
VTTLSARLGSRTSNAWGVGRGTWTKSRLELELLVAPLEAVATFEDVEGLFVMVVPMQGTHRPPSAYASAASWPTTNASPSVPTSHLERDRRGLQAQS